ncbi:putative lipase, partial [Operophtera brumata]
QHTQILNFRYALLVYSVSVCAARSNQEPAKFTFRSVRDSVLPAIQPLIAAGSNGCLYPKTTSEYFKNFFGLSYDQMQAKNASPQQNITIDLITKTGQVKNILTDTKKLRNLVHHSDKIVVLIHGFGESSEGEMVQALSSELLKQHGLKIFALDGRNVMTLEYLRSSTHSRFMGEMLGQSLSHLLCSFLAEGHDPSKISLIGHSLGSHIAGTAGKQVYQLTGKLLGRITALDPAGPCFHNVRHKDFYPNGGMSQPGCMFYICDHSRAWEFYAESINKPKAFPARKCFNWATFSAGKCNKSELAFMGVDSEEGSEGMYFLSTAPSSPFGLGPTG